MAKEKPADLSFTCFQGEAWRVCHLSLYEHTRRLSREFWPAIAWIESTCERLQNPLFLVRCSSIERYKPSLSLRFSAGFCLPPVMVQFMEVTRKNLNIQPTVKIRPGYRFNVRVNRDIAFTEPYGDSREGE
jgi:hypothetical protein